MRTLLAGILIAASATTARAEKMPALSPCDAFGAAEAVFVGTAGRPVRRAFASDGRTVTGWFSPVTVERVFRGVTTETVYLTPAGIETYLAAGQRYLVYGRHYVDPDMFMSSDAYGTKPIDDAADDLAFLDAVDPRGDGATITGVVTLDESDSAHIGMNTSPLANVGIRLSSTDRTITAQTSAGGRFAATGVPAGTYTATADLPDDLALAANATRAVRVLAGGCAALSLTAIPNGHIRGRVTFVDGRSPIGEEVSLVSAELAPGERDRYFQQVRVGPDGQFVFDGVRPGRYLIARLAFTLNGAPIAATYFPGTGDRESATEIAMTPGGRADVGEFRLPARATPQQ